MFLSLLIMTLVTSLWQSFPVALFTNCHSPRTLQNYKPGINRVPDTGGRTSQTLMVMNGAQEIGMVKHDLSGSTFLSMSDVEMAVTGYEGCVKVPGAYPESNMGV